MIVAIIAVDLGLVVFCNKIWLLFNMLDHRSMRFTRFQVLSITLLLCTFAVTFLSFKRTQIWVHGVNKDNQK